MKFARRIPASPTLEEQVKMLKSLVIVNHDDFPRNSTGIIVSLLQQGMYWVLLDIPYKTKNGHWSRKRMFKPNQIKLVED